MLPAGDERYRGLFEQSTVGMAFLALDGTVLATNGAASGMLGVLETELVGSQLPVHPDDRTGFESRIAGVASDRHASAREELRFVRPDAGVVWAEVVTQAMSGPGDTPGYLQTIMVDITARKSADEVRAQLASIVESSQEAIVSTTLEGTIVNWNRGAERIFGYSAAEMIGRHAGALRPQGSEAEISNLTRRIESRERVENRVVRVRKDGSKVTLLSVSMPVLDHFGAVVGTATVARDLDEAERADALFRSLVEAAPDAVVCVDHHGIIALVNAQAETLFGYDRDQIVGRPVELLVPEGARAAHSVLREQYVADPQPRTMRSRGGHHFVARRKDGSEFPAEISLSAVQTQEGLLVSAAIRDGTDRASAAIVASSGDAIVGRGLDGVVKSWNAGAERLFGHSAAAAVGTTMAEILPADRAAEFETLTGRVAHGENLVPFETRRIRADGSTIDVSVVLSPIRDESGAIVGTSAVSRDITESKRAVQSLREVEARKSAILESALDCIISMDHRGNVVEFNPAAERVFGYRRENVLGTPLAELVIPPDLRDAHRAGLARHLDTGEGPVLGRRLEMRATRSDGSEFPVELSITRVALPGPALFTAYLRDITDQRQAEQDRTTLSQRLRQAERLESLGQLAGGVAHDFNNLIGVIANYAAFIGDAVGDDPAITADLQQIQAAAEQAARLTRQLLVVGRREVITPELLDVNSVVTEIHDILSRSIGEHIELILRLGGSLPSALLDRGQLGQVVLNLAINARDAMPGGGSLSISTRFIELDDDYARLHPDAHVGPHVELTVTDSGTGMSPDVVEHIFEPFFTTKPLGQGTGLGLATVYGIVTSAGGTANVYSEPGLGTAVRVLLPAADEPAGQAPRSEPLESRGSGEIVVVVDDEPAMMEVTARILRRAGYTVLATTTPAEAMVLVSENDVSLLVTDCVMPGMSGSELANEIRRTRPALPVLFMSGYDQGMVGAQRVVGTHEDLIDKPFNAAELVARVGARLH